MATLSGKTLGKYQVFERIGRGGMADVYKGRHERLDRTVAIKVLHSHLAEGEDFLARFEREARAVASLRHPNIVQVYDFDREEEQMYMVMEYIGGGNLKDRLKKARADGNFLPLKEVQAILEQVAAALDTAHKEGMLHRDVKPANVMLDEEGHAYLADFGIARIVSTTQFTATGTLVGTPAYMSPEQGRGESLTPASDLYSLGIILYEMLTNSIPFDADTPLAIIHKQIHDPLPPARDLRADLPAAVEGMLEQALAKDASARFDSAAAMAEALHVALTSKGAPASPAQAPSEDMKATVVMQEVQPEDAKATVAMEENLGADLEAEPPLQLSATSEPVPEVELAEAQSSLLEKVSKLSPALIAGVVIIVLVAVAAATGLFSGGGGAGCDSVDSCLMLADQAEAEGRPEDAVAFLEAATSMVPEGEEPVFAEIWCRHGHVNLALDRPEEAIGSFERCIDWTHEEPGLEGVREEAERMIMDLRGD